MEIWFIFLVSLCISFFLSSIFTHFRSSTKLPPGPFLSFSIIINFLCLRTSTLQINSLIQTFIAKYGPVLAFRIAGRPIVFIADYSFAHNALVVNGAHFADRPSPLAVSKVVYSNQHSISSASYGPLWRLLRRNLTSQILHPSRLKSFTQARKWVLDILLDRFQSNSHSRTAVSAIDHFRYALLFLSVFMCFGDKLDESQIKNVERATHLNLGRFDIINLFPKLTKILLRKRWEEFLQLKSNQENVIIPLIEARRKIINQNRANREKTKQEIVVSYVDTLLDLQLPDEKRKLTDSEMVTIVTEFITGSTDTTSSALQWIMANLVKYPDIQTKLYEEMKGVIGDGTGEEEVKEEDLVKLPYLKAVVLEGLRRHPPAYLLLPHAVKEDTMLGNYVIPKNGTVNFMVAEMGRDPKVWEDPMEFKPERFVKGGDREGVVVFDIRGSKEIKMMPFGAGRRMCPGFGLAILHLEYFVANLIGRFEWKAIDGDEVDLSEKVEFTMVMKKPLQANVHPRF